MEIIYADTFLKRLIGLMGRKDFNQCLLFLNLTDSAIHTMFMRFEVDVYFIDENKIIYEKASLKPWRFYRPKGQAEFILETKKGLLKLKVGDELDFIKSDQ